MRNPTTPRAARLLARSTIALAGTLLSLLSPSAVHAANERPNIVLIMVDDLGYGDSRLTNPNSTVDTVRIHAIADRGVKFTNGYVASPVCSPSRAALLSSKHPARYGAENNNASRFRPGRMPAVTIASLLQGSAGKNYTTKVIGKWDLAGKVDDHGDTYMPVQRGFGGFYGIRSGISSYYRTDGTAPSDAWYSDNGTPKNDGLFTGVGQTLNMKEYVAPNYVDRNPNIYLTDKLTDEAVAFIASQPGTTTSPFFLFLSYNAPHKPYMVPGAYYQNAPGSGDQRLYHAMVANLDDNIDRVLDQLRSQQLANTTMVIFVSDNGGTGAGSSGILTGAKQTLFEGGIHTPFAIKWPAKFGNDPIVFTKPVSTMDILPTIAVAAGYSLGSLDISGKDLVPYILGTETNDPHPALYWRYVGDDNGAAMTAIRSGNFKYIREVALDRTVSEHLYDLSNTLVESPALNLVSDPAYASTKAALIAGLDAWNKANPLLEDFNNDAAYGFIPYNSTVAPAGTWSVTGSNYQITDGRAGDRSIAQMTYFENATFEADLTLLENGRAGIVFHSSNHSVGSLNFDGYYAQVSVLNAGDSISLHRVSGGVSTEIASATASLDLNTTYHMKIVANNGSLAVYVGNMASPVFTTTDSTFSGGSVGVRLGTPPASGATSTASFDNVAVTPL